MRQAAKPGSTAEEEPNAQRGPDFGLGLEVVQFFFFFFFRCSLKVILNI